MWGKIASFAKKAIISKSVDKGMSESSGSIFSMIKIPFVLGGTVVFVGLLVLFFPLFMSSSTLTTFFMQAVDKSGDTAACNETVEAYLNWAKDIAEDNSHGYNQCARNGPDYDCSSLVWHSLVHGANMNASDLGGGAFTTYVMSNLLQKVGFEEHRYNASELQPGDILLFPGNISAGTGHTEIYYGDGKTVGAHIAETGGVCGQNGDQTGHEIDISANTNPNWEYYYRLASCSSDENDSSASGSSTKSSGSKVVDRARAEIGKAYSWGGIGPDSYDCSGFVSYALTGKHQRLGTTYTFLGWPRTNNPKPGDVAVNSGHTGIYIGNGKMIHAATYGVGVIEGPVQAGMVFVKYPG